MSDSLLSLTYVRSNHRLRADHNQNVARTLKNSVIKSLTVDARRIAEVATVGAGEFFWIVQKVHHQVYRGYVWYWSGGTDTHQGGSHTPPVQIWRRFQETIRPFTSVNTHPPLVGLYQLTSPLLAWMMKIQPRDRLRLRLDVWGGTGQAVIPTCGQNIYISVSERHIQMRLPLSYSTQPGGLNW